MFQGAIVGTGTIGHTEFVAYVELAKVVSVPKLDNR